MSKIGVVDKWIKQKMKTNLKQERKKLKNSKGKTIEGNDTGWLHDGSFSMFVLS